MHARARAREAGHTCAHSRPTPSFQRASECSRRGGVGAAIALVSWLPQYHDMGLIGSNLGTIAFGGSAVLKSPFQFVRVPGAWIRALARYRGTHTQAPSFAFALAARKWRPDPSGAVRLDSVRHVLNAAEPVDAAAIDAFESVFCGPGKRAPPARARRRRRRPPARARAPPRARSLPRAPLAVARA